MTNQKVFRVLISETQGFYVDIEADDADTAVQKVRDNLGDLTPIEDTSAYTGYEVESASEINREDADLEGI